MKVLLAPAHAELVIQRSRFQAFLEPLSTPESTRQRLKALRETFPEANHVCHAFVLGLDHRRTVGFSDDGEPGGTAGRPMLAVLEGAELGNAFAAVVRVFGGIKLGTAGLAAAYGGALRAALAVAPIEEYVPRVSVGFSLDYRYIIPLKQKLAQIQGSIHQQEFGESVFFTVEIPVAHESDLESYCRDLSRGQCAWRRLPPISGALP